MLICAFLSVPIYILLTLPELLWSYGQFGIHITHKAPFYLYNTQGFRFGLAALPPPTKGVSYLILMLTVDKSKI